VTRRSYTAEQRAEARAAYEEHGPREAERQTGIPASTLTKMAKRNGWGTRWLAKAENQAKRAHYDAEAFRHRMQELLAEIADTAAKKELSVLADEAPSLEKIVGARTRAIHDLQLLSGGATSRTEHEHIEPLDRELARLAAEVKANG
jgi:ribosomal protein S6